MARAPSAPKPAASKTVTTIQHDDAKRKNIPTAEYQSVLEKQKLAPTRVSYPRAESGVALEAEKAARNRDLDPQLVWRGKDQQDWSDLVVHAPPPYIQEKVHAKALTNFQWSTTSRDVKDGNAGHITREPEQVKAFRDTWRDGIHSYLTYLRDRLTVGRDLLAAQLPFHVLDENVDTDSDEVSTPKGICSTLLARARGIGSWCQEPSRCRSFSAACHDATLVAPHSIVVPASFTRRA
jgi:hypothetical protein